MTVSNISKNDFMLYEGFLPRLPGKNIVVVLGRRIFAYTGVSDFRQAAWQVKFGQFRAGPEICCVFGGQNRSKCIILNLTPASGFEPWDLLITNQSSSEEPLHWAKVAL